MGHAQAWALADRSEEHARAQPRRASEPPLLALQRAAGNRAVARMLEPKVGSRCPCGGTILPGGECSKCRARRLAAESGGAAALSRAVAARRTLQRTIGDGHDLASPRFAKDDDLEACYDDEARLTLGGRGQAGARKVESGEGVKKVQEALVELGYLASGEATGTYNEATWDAVKRLKADKGLGWEWMGDVGPGTMAWLDRRFPPSPTPPPPIPPPPTPPARVCGPDVTSEVRRVWSSVRPAFDRLTFRQKLDNCRMLVQPLTTDEHSGDIVLNADAFDTWGLFQNSASWTRISPWHGSCGTPGSTGDHCQSRDPAHEATDVCSNTVQIGSNCWLSGTPNYGLFGVAMRTCHDFLTPLSFLPPPLNHAQDLFGLANTMVLAGGYKLVKGDNIVGPEKWVSATWLGGPTATASTAGVPESGGARPRCSTTCPGPPPPPFSIVWMPHMPRSAVPAGPPYLPNCPTP